MAETTEEPPMNVHLSRSLTLTLLTIILLLIAWPLDAGESPATNESIERGAELYKVYCRTCHGIAGQGDGPFVELLRVKPTDLTLITQVHDGVFPEQDVYKKIDGRISIAAHGSREMPIWGLSFADPSRDSDQEKEISGRINDLVDWIRSIQATKQP